MNHSKKPGDDRAKYLIGFVLLAAVALIGISAYFGANSAKDTLGKPDGSLEGARAENSSAGMPSFNGSAEPENPAVPPGQPTNGSIGAQAAPNGSVATGPGGEAQVPQPPIAPAEPKKEVTIDFLYADWCGHCQTMKPIVAKLEAALPKDRFEVRYWNEASRSNATVGAIYAAYTDKGYFQGFPTFVANGDNPKVGSMPEATFKSWVCSMFSSPKPTGC